MLYDSSRSSNNVHFCTSSKTKARRQEKKNSGNISKEGYGRYEDQESSHENYDRQNVSMEENRGVVKKEKVESKIVMKKKSEFQAMHTVQAQHDEKS